MCSITNDFEFTWSPIFGELLICKNDPNIDVGWLETLTSNQLIAEIKVESDDFPPQLSRLIHRIICVGYFNMYDEYRIFQVEDIDSKIKQQPYFVGILKFDQKSFEDFILCCYLLYEVIGIQQTIALSIKKENEIRLDFNQAVQSIKNLFSPLEDQIRDRIKTHMLDYF